MPTHQVWDTSAMSMRRQAKRPKGKRCWHRCRNYRSLGTFRRITSPVYMQGLNDKDQAFEWLERAYQERCNFLTLLKFETVFDNLHADPRFKELVKRMNLPE